MSAWTKELAKERGEILALIVDANREIDRLCGALRADEARLREADARVSAVPHGCDAPEWMADTILVLRAEIARAFCAGFEAGHWAWPTPEHATREQLRARAWAEFTAAPDRTEPGATA